MKAPDIAGNITYSCSLPDARYPLKPGQVVAYCWHIHGDSDYDVYGYRSAKNGAASIKFNFYSTDYQNGTVRVGTLHRPYNVTGVATCAGRQCVVNSPVTTHFEGNDNPNMPAGQYVYTNSKTHYKMAVLDKADANSWNENAICGGGPGNWNITGGDQMGTTNVKISVETNCNVKADDMNFGKQPGLNKPLTASANVYVDCSAGTDFEATIDNGQHFANGTRRMERQKDSDDDAVTYVNYSIDVDHWSGTGWGTGINQAPFQTITGTVPPQPAPMAGTYKDSLRINVTYQNNFPQKGGR